jgi:hypothetical protein
MKQPGPRLALMKPIRKLPAQCGTSLSKQPLPAHAFQFVVLLRSWS